jgi:hypothetical protein
MKPAEEGRVLSGLTRRVRHRQDRAVLHKFRAGGNLRPASQEKRPADRDQRAECISQTIDRPQSIA